MRFGIVGCGLIGGKRAEAIRALGHSVVSVADKSRERAEAITKQWGGAVAADAEAVASHPEVEAVIISTTNDVATPLACQALRHDKHVLVEKPAGRNVEELSLLVSVAKSSKGICRIGFNHRFHPGIQHANQILKSGGIGELLYIRARYGHGGRPGYDREWRANPALSGGGELLDQGVHLIDLCRWMGGEVELEFGKAITCYWDMPVDDNGFLLLKSASAKWQAWLHASCTEWKNIFDFELFGRNGKLQVFGLGKSYGPEELRHYTRRPEGGAPDLVTHQYPAQDDSWKDETKAFEAAASGASSDIGRPEDALRAIEIVDATYRNSR